MMAGIYDRHPVLTHRRALVSGDASPSLRKKALS